MAKKPANSKPLRKVPEAARSKSAKPAPAAKPKAAKAVSATQQLKKVDEELVNLMNRRAELMIEQIDNHEETQTTFNDSHKERELFGTLEKLADGPLPFKVVQSIYREIINGVRHHLRPSRVAYLGPAYSFTHIAATDRFGSNADLVPVNTIAAVFDEVNRGHVDYGVVPIENSTDGRIVDTLDMFQRLPLKICSEVQVSVHHNLLSRSPRSEITEIYSKPQAISQCRDWLARNMPKAQLFEVTSTSTAAQLARDKPGTGAIASRQAAVQYGLDTIAANIEDNPSNVTRFAVIGDDVTKPSGHDRTSLLLHIPHTPGSLSDALSAFKRNKVNLTWIESFPLRGTANNYLFFLDFEGHQDEPDVKKTLQELEKKAVSLRLLGSYPRSEPID